LKCCCFVGEGAILGIFDHLRRRLAQFKLGAHLLDFLIRFSILNCRFSIEEDQHSPALR